MRLRMTNQREIILKALRKSRQHLTADELYERVRKVMPRISLATVYRNLERLSEAGVIAKLEISGRQKRFDYDVGEHDHIYCVECQRVDNVEIERNSATHLTSDSEIGYEITGYRIELVGVCPTCQMKLDNQEDHGPHLLKRANSPKVEDEHKQILAALAANSEPCGSQDLTSATGLPNNTVSSGISAMQKRGLVTSPKHSKYTITEEGKAILR